MTYTILKNPLRDQMLVVTQNTQGEYSVRTTAPNCRVCRLIKRTNNQLDLFLPEFEPCSCVVVWSLSNGNCPCAPSDNSNPIIMVMEGKAQ